MENSKSPIIGVLEQIKGWMERMVGFARFLGAVSSFVFIFSLFFQVFLRYVFGRPIYGIEEMVIGLMVWYCSLGTAVVYWERGHACIEFFLKFFPQKVRLVLLHMSNFIVVATSWVFILSGLQLFRVQYNTMPVGGLPFSRAWYYALPVTVMGVILFVTSLFRTIEFFFVREEGVVIRTEEEGGAVND